MNFEEEWAQLKENAQAEQKASMQLDSGGATGSNSGGKQLHVTPSVLRDRANKSEHGIAKDFREAQKTAIDDASDVAGSMKGFASDEALKDYVQSWRRKVSYVEGLLGKNGVAGALRSTADSLGYQDQKTGEGFSTPKEKYHYKSGDVI